MNKKDIHIFYGAGSGGFIAAHTILQSQQHFCVFTSYPKFYPKVNSKLDFLEQFDQVRQHQWGIKDPALWKSTEVWPHTTATQQHSIDGMNRLYLSCNNFYVDQTATNVLIHTDLESQLDLGHYKKTFIVYESWFLRNQDKMPPVSFPEIHKVIADTADFFPLADHTIRLQDLIRTKGKCLTDCLGLPWTDEHEKLIDHWIRLHPPELIEKILSR